MKLLSKILLVSLSFLTTVSFANELGNPGFEDNTSGLAHGNNFSPNINVSPWVMSSGSANVVRIDGPGGSNYGNNGPEFDASSAPPGIPRHYLDISGGNGTFYQPFTTPEECSGEVRFGGFLSTRGNAGGVSHIEIRQGTGDAGTLIGTTAVINIPGGNSQSTPWTPVNFATTLSAGTTYSFVIFMDNQLNFDEAYVNFVDGPCKDGSDLDDPEPQQCLVLEPKVECVANQWQVSISNTSSSSAEVMDITSLTSGVTISGNSPNWILNGALPNSAVDISVDGTVVGGGSAEFADLCCSTELHLDIPDEECEITEEKPHIYTRKSMDVVDGKDAFRFILDSLVQLNAPTVLKITDTIPVGVTLTSLDSSNTVNWSCPGLPITGPGALECTYIGTMPIPAGKNFNVIVYADIEPSEEVRENCIATTLIDTDGTGIPYDGNQANCVDIPPTEFFVGKSIELFQGPEGVGNGEFTLGVISTPINAPNVLVITDTLPIGVTLHSVSSNSRPSSTDWSCPGLPITGPAVLNCTYIGAMPTTQLLGVVFAATIDFHEEPRVNCMDATVYDELGGEPIELNGLTNSCVDIPPEVDGEDVLCIDGQVFVDGQCVLEELDDVGDADVPLACNSNIIIVADESASIKIANATTDVSDAMKSFVKGFKGNASKAAMIHFSTNAELEKPMTEIATAPGQEGHFLNNYSPLTGQTNWEAGLDLALTEVNANPGSIVFFITDGQPNRYLDNAGNVQIGTEAQSVAEAVTVANDIKAAGSRIIAIGVGDISSSTTAQANLNSIASSTSDTIIDEISNLNQIAINYATQACPDIYLDKKTLSGFMTILENGALTTDVKPEFRITVTNNTTTTLTGVEVQDALPTPKLTFNSFSVAPTNGSASQVGDVITWNGITLAPAASATLNFKANIEMQGPINLVYNYAQVTAVDQTVSSVNPLSNPKSGPLNPDDKDEGKSIVQIYTFGPPSDPCTATESNPDNCLEVEKTMIVENEGDCLPGATCKYKIKIRNRSNLPYTNPLNLSDSFTPMASSAITVTATGSAPDPMCSPTPTSIPFSCIQNTDIPANTSWYYTITTIVPASGVTKNCFTANSETACADHTSSKSLIIDKPDEEITIDKSAPKTCKSGQKCEFTFDITNNTSEPFKGFAGITDKPKKRFGRIRGSSKDWQCQKKGSEYRCGIEELTLKPSETEKVTLTLQVPRSLVGQVENCASIETETSVSKQSCTVVEIIKDSENDDRKCGYDDKLVNGRCVARCRSKNANWNGVDCMVCSKSKVWNDRYKRCDKKPRENIVRSCPTDYKWNAARKRCVEINVKPPACEKDMRWDSRVRKCVSTLPPKCNKGTKWDVNQKRCVEIRIDRPSCGKDTRWDQRVGKCVSTLPPKCNKGTKWDVNQKRCVEIRVDRPSCGKDTRWDPRASKCVSTLPPKCNQGTKWDVNQKRCIEIRIIKPTGCKGGTQWDQKTRKCISAQPKKCEYGYKFNQETRKCENSCGFGKRLVAGRCVGIRDVINIYNIFKGGGGGDRGTTGTPDIPGHP